MALDSRNQRASAISVAHATIPVFPNPDGGLSAADREQTGWGYRLLADSPTPPAAGTSNVQMAALLLRHRTGRV